MKKIILNILLNLIIWKNYIILGKNFYIRKKKKMKMKVKKKKTKMMI